MRAFTAAFLIGHFLAGAVAGTQSPVTAVPGADEEGLVAVNGTELFVRRQGAGEPIVVVHGGPLLEHGYLEPHLAPLADAYELIFYDQRLSGRSAASVDPDSVRVDVFVEDIEALRVALGLDRVHLLAHSWGGMLAMRYALRYPQNLRSLILVSPMAASSELWLREEAIVAERVTDRDRQDRLDVSSSEAYADGDPEAIERLLVLSMRPQFHDPSRLSDLRFAIPEDYNERWGRFSALGADLESFDYHDELEDVDVRTLIVYGDAEPGGPIGGAAIAERLPDASMVTIARAGHFAFIEQPDRFLETVREFLGGRAR